MTAGSFFGFCSSAVVVISSLTFIFGLLERNTMSDEESNGLMGWVIFILIFGVGNAILYYFTGVFFIPIPRK